MKFGNTLVYIKINISNGKRIIKSASTAEGRRYSPISIRFHDGPDRHIKTRHANEQTDNDGQQSQNEMNRSPSPFSSTTSVVVGGV